MTGLISVDEAFARLARHRVLPRTERVSLADAQGRMLAEPVSAAVSRPPADVSAMDGYAVRLADVSQAGARLRVIAEAPAGAPFEGHLSDGETVRIFTGGALPKGADHIVIQEDAVRDGDFITCNDGYSTPQFVRRAGLDFKHGETLLDAGTRLGPAELALIAAANIADVAVGRRIRVGILTNGNELMPPGSKLAPGQIVNSNPYSLGAMIRDWGGEPVDLGTAQDTLDSIAAHIGRAEDIDIFLPVGGASVGDYDLMRPAFAAAGFSPVFEKIAVRPGKPTWFSERDGQRVLGLPGNPASAMVCAELFLKPLITGKAHRFVKAAAAQDVSANGPREHYMRAAITNGEDGRLTADPAANQDSSLIRPFLTSAGLVRRNPDSPAVKAGDLVDLLMIRAL